MPNISPAWPGGRSCETAAWVGGTFRHSSGTCRHRRSC